MGYMGAEDASLTGLRPSPRRGGGKPVREALGIGVCSVPHGLSCTTLYKSGRAGQPVRDAGTRDDPLVEEISYEISSIWG